MRIEETRKQTPGSVSSGSSDDRETEERKRFVWEVLAPQLLHPSKLAFIKALLEQGQPLTATELAEAADITEEHARYQCRSMEKAGVLEVVSVAARRDGEGDEPSYFFPEPLQAATPSPAVST